MLKIRYAKNTYGPKCQNTHGPKLWLLDTWAWAHGPGPMGPCPFFQEPKVWPMSILAFGPISIFSIPFFFQHT